MTKIYFLGGPLGGQLIHLPDLPSKVAYSGGTYFLRQMMDPDNGTRWREYHWHAIELMDIPWCELSFCPRKASSFCAKQYGRLTNLVRERS